MARNGVNMTLRGERELINRLKAFAEVGEREIRRANLETGFLGLTDTRKNLTEWHAVDTGGLRASYHLESRGEAGEKEYWQDYNVRGDGTWDAGDEDHPGWLHAPLTLETSVLIGSNAPHAAVTEYGRRPGATPPPPDALKPWLRRHNLPENLAYPIAQKIGREGLPPRPAFLWAMEALGPKHTVNLQRAIKRAANLISEGR